MHATVFLLLTVVIVSSLDIDLAFTDVHALGEPDHAPVIPDLQEGVELVVSASACQ